MGTSILSSPKDELLRNRHTPVIFLRCNMLISNCYSSDMSQTILIVDDEQPIRDMVCFALQQAQYTCRQAEDAEAAVNDIAEQRPDLILLDVMMPRVSGLEFARKLQSRDIYKDIPIIMLTAKTEETDKLKGFDSGCDDYISKPFSTRELIARIKAVLKRSSSSTEDLLTLPPISLDPQSHRVTANDNEIQIGPTEYRLLKFFLSHIDRVYSRAQLLDYVWGETTYIEERTVDVHIRRLRKILQEYQIEHYIQTVRGAGYRFSDKD